MLFLYKMHKIKASITAVGSSKRHVALSINTAETMNHILFIWAMNLWIIFHKNWDPHHSLHIFCQQFGLHHFKWHPWTIMKLLFLRYDHRSCIYRCNWLLVNVIQLKEHLIRPCSWLYLLTTFTECWESLQFE